MNYVINGKEFRELLSADTIERAIGREAARIREHYANLDPVFVIVLKGAMFFAVDLIRAVAMPCTVEVLSAKSYGDAMESSGELRLSEISAVIRNRHVVVIEDIVDTGLTLKKILDQLKHQFPASVQVATLLSKPSVTKEQLELRYCCFEVGPEFLIGYGLDYAEQGRELKAVYALHRESAE